MPLIHVTPKPGRKVPLYPGSSEFIPDGGKTLADTPWLRRLEKVHGDVTITEVTIDEGEAKPPVVTTKK